MNIRSICANFVETELFLQEFKPRILMLSESRQTEDINDQELNVENYTLLRCDSFSRKTGGIIMYISNDIKFSVIKNCCETKSWFLFIKVEEGMKKGVYGAVYKSPHQKNKEFLKILESVLEDLIDYNNFNLIAGDFNINFLINSKYTKKIKSLLDQFNLKQLVTVPTRIAKNSKTLIDYVISNNENIDCSIMNENKISDHETINIKLLSYPKEKVNKKIMKTIFKYSKKNLMDNLKDWNWANFTNLSVDEKAKFLYEGLKNVADKMKIKIEVRENHNNKWFDKECDELKKKLRKSTKNKDQSNETAKIYKDLKNDYRNLIKAKKNEYTKDKINKNANDPKKLWCEINSLFKTKNKKIECIEFDSGIEFEDKIKANKLNQFYASSLKNIIDNISSENDNEDFLSRIPINDYKFEFSEVDENKVVSVVNLMRNKNHDDGISGRMLADAMENQPFKFGFTQLINESLKQGIVPKIFKVCLIEPIEKVKNAKKPEQFRPINKMPVMERVIEHIVKEQLDAFVALHDILVENQSGFRKNHSCETAINNVIYSWNEMLEKGEIVVVVALDFKRAFETLDRRITLKKLQRYGIDGTALKWFIDYLENVFQKVKIGEDVSELIEILYGLCQGTILATILYILGINDLICTVKHGNVSLFADDTLISVSGRTLEEAVGKMNENLENLRKWLNFNKICLNTSKSHFMVVTHKRIDRDEQAVIIGSEQIERVDEIKYLGVIIDDRLSFMSHLDYIKKKLNSKLALFRRLDSDLNAENKILLYKSLVAPHFEYCSSILFCLSDSNIQELQKMQNKFMRNILKMNRFTSSDFMLDALCFQSVKQRLTFNMMKMFYKIENGLMPKYLQRYLKKNNTRYNYSSRRKSLFEVPNFTKEFNQKSMFYKGLKLYNDLKADFNKEDFKNLNTFCKKLKIFVKNL